MQFHCDQIVVRTNEPTEVEPDKATQEAQSKNAHVDKAKKPPGRNSRQNVPLGPATPSCGRLDRPRLKGRKRALVRVRVPQEWSTGCVWQPSAPNLVDHCEASGYQFG